jgi:outer membrane phospholipase A
VLNQLFGLQSTTVSVQAPDFNANILPNHNAIDLCLRLTSLAVLLILTVYYLLYNQRSPSEQLKKSIPFATFNKDKPSSVGIKPPERPSNDDKPRLDVIQERAKLEQFSHNKPFVLTPHRSNYVLPMPYRDNIFDYNSLIPNGGGINQDNVELEFQLNIKVLVRHSILTNNGSLNIGYTNRSFWQAYNSLASSPFRETNHEPEPIVSFANNWQWLGLTSVSNQIIFNRQSNGRSEPISRRWNRLMLNFIFERDRFAMSFKPWCRIKEEQADDNNPDIEKYLGHFK